MPLPPHIEDAIPKLSSTLGNSTLRIAGTGFDEAVAVMIDNAYVASFRRINDQAITITLPPTSPGTHTVRVVGRDGSVATFASCATVEPTAATPVISFVTPLIDKYDKCDAPDFYRRRRVLVEGTNFTRVSAVYTDGVSREFRILDATHLEYEQPRQSPSECKPRDPSQRIAARDAVIKTQPFDLASSVQQDPEIVELKAFDKTLIHASDIQLVTSDGQASQIFQFLALQPPRRRSHEHQREQTEVVVRTVPLGRKVRSCSRP